MLWRYDAKNCSGSSSANYTPGYNPRDIVPRLLCPSDHGASLSSLNEQTVYVSCKSSPSSYHFFPSNLISIKMNQFTSLYRFCFLSSFFHFKLHRSTFTLNSSSFFFFNFMNKPFPCRASFLPIRYTTAIKIFTDDFVQILGASFVRLYLQTFSWIAF